MISCISQRSSTHNSCEDSSFVREYADYIIGGIFDGCSTGVNSHFASQLYSYIFQSQSLRFLDFTDNDCIHSIRDRLVPIANQLNLSHMNLLSTIVLFEYNIFTEQLKVRTLGDAVYYVNGVEYVVDQNNEPDYLAYHMNEGYYNFQDYLDKYPVTLYYDVKTFAICSDGILSFERSQFLEPAKIENPIQHMLQPPNSTNFLTRMFNVLTKQKYIIKDDLSIISYVQDKKDGEPDQV